MTLHIPIFMGGEDTLVGFLDVDEDGKTTGQLDPEFLSFFTEEKLRLLSFNFMYKPSYHMRDIFEPLELQNKVQALLSKIKRETENESIRIQ